MRMLRQALLLEKQSHVDARHTLQSNLVCILDSMVGRSDCVLAQGFLALYLELHLN